MALVGHSLGGALALLDAVFLPLHLPTGTKFTTITYGMPRVGNQAFADYVDAHVTNLSHINNKKDPVPILATAFHRDYGAVTWLVTWKSEIGSHEPLNQCACHIGNAAWRLHPELDLSCLNAQRVSPERETG